MTYDQYKTATPPEYEIDNNCAYCGEACEKKYCNDWCKKGYETEN